MKVKFRETGEEVEVYGIHKSGPANDGSQTKFLVCALGEWGWMPCNSFVASQTIKITVGSNEERSPNLAVIPLTDKEKRAYAKRGSYAE